MKNRLLHAAALVAALLVGSIAATGRDAAPAVQGNSWILGEDAETRTNPLTADEKTLADGKALFKNKCQRCHGPGGLGDGPDADPDASIEMDLTNPKRIGRNPDGVVYYKVLNGRARPKMPAFKDELTEQQIWAVVTYVQTLRKK
jgi:mono/diheme cytochrome c family protein